MGGKKTTVVNVPTPDPSIVAQQQLAMAQPIIDATKKRMLELDYPEAEKLVEESMWRRGLMGGVPTQRKATLQGDVLDQLARLSQAKTEATATATSNAILQGMANLRAGEQMSAESRLGENLAFQNAISNLAQNLGYMQPKARVYTGMQRPIRAGSSNIWKNIDLTQEY